MDKPLELDCALDCLQPLPRIEQAELAGTRLDALLGRIPGIGWIWADLRWQQRAAPWVRRINAHLTCRPPETTAAVFDEPLLLDTASIVENIAREEIGWHTGRFIPEDPLATVLWAHVDGLDDIGAILAVEERFGIQLPEAWIEAHWAGRWGDFVNAVHQKRTETNRFSQESETHPTQNQ